MARLPYKPIISNARRITIIYVVVSLSYIYFSDCILRFLNTDVVTLTHLQSVKGTAFVFLSGCLLFFLVSRYSREIVNHYNSLSDERTKSFDDLKKSEEKYWTVFNYSPLPMWIYDINTLQFLLVNEAACNKYGYSKEEFYKMGIDDIRPAGQIPQLWKAVKQASKTKHKVWDQPYDHFRKDGTKLLVRIESAEIQYDNRVARLIIATDVTQKIKDEQLLLEANLKLKSASNIANLGYWSFDLNTSKIYWSENVYTIFEQDKHTFELNVENVLDQFYEEDRQHFSFDAHFDDHEIKELEHRIVTRTGEKWILQRINLIRNEKGIPVMLEGVVLDISERKRAQQAMQVSNERFRMVAKAAIEAIVDWDIQTGDVFWGDGFLELFGYEPAINDKTLWIRNIHPDDKKRVKQNLRNALCDKNRAHFYEEFRFIKMNGDVAFVEHRGMFIRNENGVAVRAVGAMIDVTQLKEKIQKIERQNNQLKEIAWIQSHVVRAPLATLMGLANLLSEPRGNIDPAEIIPDMIDCANKLDDVIREIVARADQIEKSPVMTA